MRGQACTRRSSDPPTACLARDESHQSGAAHPRTISSSGYIAAALILLVTSDCEARQPAPESGNRAAVGSVVTPGGLDYLSEWSSVLEVIRRSPERGSGLAATAQSGAPDVRPGVEVLDEYLALRIHYLEQRSPRFRAAMALARQGPIAIVIGTPAQVRDRVAPQLSLGLKLGSDRVGEFLVQMDEPGSPRIDLIVVRVHRARLQAAARWRSLLGSARAQRWLDSTTDAILIHEIWGHLIPVLEAGDYTGNCPDPTPGQHDLDSCVMQRENGLRAEIGLKPRKRYSIHLLGS
jgi:hypothetical protein